MEVEEGRGKWGREGESGIVNDKSTVRMCPDFRSWVRPAVMEQATATGKTGRWRT